MTAKGDGSVDSGLVHGIRSRCKGVPGLFQQFLNYLDEDYIRRREREAYEKNGIRVISAGPNAFFYFLDEEQPCDFETVEKRFPGLVEKLSQSPGVGLVLARTSSGPVCYCQGKRYLFPDSGAGPFSGRADAALVVKAITELMAMPSAGDLVIYGTGAAEGDVSFIPEHGAHAGPSAEEMNTFLLGPSEMLCRKTITHPSQLYAHFIQYQVGFAHCSKPPPEHPDISPATDH